MPGSEKVSSDMTAEQREYHERRRELEALLPTARRLCLKYRLRDPFLPSLHHEFAPRSADDPRNGDPRQLAERAVVRGRLAGAQIAL